MQRRHRVASNHGQVLWVVIKDNDWLVDGQIDGMRGGTTRIVRPNRVHRLGHVHCWCT